jgi:hypothetical protein
LEVVAKSFKTEINSHCHEVQIPVVNISKQMEDIKEEHVQNHSNTYPSKRNGKEGNGSILWLEKHVSVINRVLHKALGPAQWQEQRNQSGQQSLQAALAKAELATQSPEPYPDAWQTLAQTHLRLARGAGPAQRGQHIAQGLEAVQKVFALNPNHALGLATQAELLLLRSQSERDPSTKQQLAQAARQALQRALAHDTLLSYTYESLLDSARVLSAAAQNTK